MHSVSNRIRSAASSDELVERFYFASRYAERRSDSRICDFTFGNPHEMPLPALVESIRRHAVPRNDNWFAYKTSEAEPQSYLAASLSRELSLSFEPEDIALTNGAFAAISVAFRLLLDAGDEAIFATPAWFSYEPILLAADSVPKKVHLQNGSFDLDLEAIERAITARTRLVIVNTPHNPTGRIYSGETLAALSQILTRGSQHTGRPIFLLSDEPYRRIRFDGRGFTSPGRTYPWTVVTYSYAKVTLAPGLRLGYLAVSPLMPRAEREALRGHMFAAQMALGWCFPNAILQYALADIDALSCDIAALTTKRDWMAGVLEKAGYELLRPEGTFYMFCKCPGGDAGRFWSFLASRDVFVIPGGLMGAPKHFRICLTASPGMIERSLPIFAEAIEIMRN
ncbi:MAG: aminotransferase class I/II-fold pyridoxal phosphate-dependent enzyme [Methylocapsa sp.]|nr:aminotransferase class I/II-fold pyridoxal phosphate-dependent enzyme [Methylocapsa sp.]